MSGFGSRKTTSTSKIYFADVGTRINGRILNIQKQ